MIHLGRKVHTIYMPDGHPTILTNEHSNIVYTRSTIYIIHTYTGI